ncbi:hypothetical protein QEN19_001394 [Hanseniaspora menglaensis]
MFHLVQSIYNKIKEKPEYSVLILGIENSGKTTFLEQLKKKSKMNFKNFNKIMPTMGQNVANIPIIGENLLENSGALDRRNNDLVLRVWDLSGQKKLRKLWSRYFDKCHAIIYILDSSLDEKDENMSAKMADVVSVFKNDLLSLLNTNNHNIPILILANKQDKSDVVDIVDLKIAFNQELQKTDEDFDSRILPISAVTGEGVDVAVNWLVTRLRRNSETRPPVYK